MAETESRRDRITVAELAAEFLESCGVRVAFGVISVHNSAILDAIGRRGAIRFVMSRGEMGGAHMADGYARAGACLGALVTSTGPGAANAVPGLLEALLAGSPVLHLTGQTATAFADRGLGAVHDVPDQAGMLRSVSKSVFRIRAAETAFGTLLRAASEALSPPQGPVSVEIPIDIQRASVARPAELDRVILPIAPPIRPDAASLASFADRIGRARRPLLWLGGGARHAGAAARRLLDLGFGMATSWNGRGIVAETDPRTLGALNSVISPRIDAFFRTVDLMIVAGSRLRHQQSRDMSAFFPQPIAQIDIDPQAQGRTYPAETFLCADSAASLDLLADAVAGTIAIDPAYQSDLVAAKTEAIAEINGRLGPYAGFPGALRQALPRDGLFVRDITLSNNVWGHHTFPVLSPHDSLFPVAAGIGTALPLGIGAALAASGRKTVVLCGDGGFFLNPGELWTAVQEQADIVILVMNDNGYSVIRHIQDGLHGGRHYFTELLNPDLAGLAELAGIRFFRVREARQFGAVMAEALGLQGPVLVEVDMGSIGPFPYGYTPPKAAASGGRP